MGNKGRELITQPQANNYQLQAQNNSNIWVVNLSSTHCPRCLLSKGSNYAVAPKPLHLEYITSIESACQKLDNQGAET